MPHIDVTDRARVYAEVQHFFARQIRLLDAADVEGFAATFTEDGRMHHASRDDDVRGRAAIVESLRANFAQHQGVVPRHWFDKLLIEPSGEDTVTVSYYALVTLTHADGSVTLLPTCLVDDVLVVRDGQLLTQSRSITRDDLLLVPSARRAS
ncbi:MULTISPECIES: nuclear transport factor 2 family protein [Amycolatopsis]|uniref:nuclear transport factor 2 family protein n=1 Tax=Amycolatopsis TaxID=1813 RepID=UPI00041CFA7C|nr:nuclear transport factor 2 family protein [Amycolatopsis thermoflava]